MNLRNLALAMIFAFAAQSGGLAQDDKSWWNPFASNTSSSSKSTSRTAASSKMPEFKLPTWTSKSETSKLRAPKKKSPSTFSRVGDTSKKWWNNTVDFMNPFDNKKKKTSSYQPRKQVKSGSGMFGWMYREEEVQAPTSVPGFLTDGKRPGFYNDNP